MSDVCSHCGANAIELDEEGKVEVCSNCGVVCNEGSFHDDGKFQAERSFISDHRREEENWRKKRQNRLIGITQNVMNAKKCLEGIAERLRLPKEYISQVNEKLKYFYEQKLYKGLPRNRKAVVGCWVYIVCRQNDMVVTLNNVSEAARCHMSVLARCVRAMKKACNIELKALNPEQLITNIFSQYKIQDPSMKNLVDELFRFCSETMICSGKELVSTMMALIYMSIESINGRPVSNKKFAEVCRLNTLKTEQIRRFVRHYRSELFKFAKEIPWISSTCTSTNVPKFLREILDYYKNCEDHNNVNFKLKWQEKQDVMEKEKMLRIEKAQKRLDACREHLNDQAMIDDDCCLHKNCKPISSDVSQNPNCGLPPSSALASASFTMASASESSTVTLPSTSSTIVNPAEAKGISSDHTCCPHCCINKISCPVYQKNGVSDFCKRDRYDLIVECLLRKGYSKEELMQGNPESILFSENHNSDSEAEKEELDENDIPEQDLHFYIKSDSEVDQIKVLLSDNSHYYAKAI